MVGLLVAARLALALAPAGAGVDLSWSAPAGCPSEAEVRAKLDALLGATLVSEWVVAAARVERTQRGYSAQLVVAVGEHRSERTLAATQCVALADATALVIAVTMDPAASLEAALVPDTPADTAEEPPAIAVVPDPAPLPAAEVEVATAPTPSADLAPLPTTSTSARRPRVRIAGIHARVFGGLEPRGPDHSR